MQKRSAMGVISMIDSHYAFIIVAVASKTSVVMLPCCVSITVESSLLRHSN